MIPLEQALTRLRQAGYPLVRFFPTSSRWPIRLYVDEIGLMAPITDGKVLAALLPPIPASVSV